MNIRQKFITTLLLIGLLPMLVVGVIAYNTINSAQQRSTTEQLNSTVVKQEQKIMTILQAKQEELVKLANQFSLQVQLRDYISHPTAVSRGALASILQAKKVSEPTMQSVYLLNTAGEIITSSDLGDTQPSLPDGVASVNADAATQVFIRKDPLDGFNKLYITSTVTVNKQPAARIAAIFRADDLVAVVQDYTGLGETGETVVTAKDDLSLLPLRFDTEATLKTSLADLGSRGATDGSYKESTDYRGQRVFVVARPVNSTDWIVAAKIDRSEAFAPVFILRDTLMAAVFVASFMMVLVALLFTRLFTRPILQIGEVSEQIGHGNFSAKLDIRRKDEIGALARSVNNMGSSLRELIGGIESQRQRLQVVLDSTVEGIFAIDNHGRVGLANNAAAKFLSTTPADLVGRDMNELFHWMHGKQAIAVDYLSSGVRTYSDLMYTDPTGALHYAKVSVAGVADAQHHKTRAIVTVNDETAGHELENMKTDFVSLAAHELRTPLTAVRGYLEVALYKESQGDSSDTTSFVRQALKNVAELGGLINNLLDVSRIERGTFTLIVEKVDLVTILTRLIEDVKFAADDRDISLTFTSKESGPAYVVGDELALREVFNNLLMNAIKYNRNNGKVEVALTQKDTQYEVKITDTGAGIVPDALPRLFTKFYRVHGGLASGSGGTGLGLFIAKSIAERHHGKISVQSTVGKGSTFMVTLPIFTEEAFKKQRPAGEVETNVRRKRGWITKNIAR